MPRHSVVMDKPIAVRQALIDCWDEFRDPKRLVEITPDIDERILYRFVHRHKRAKRPVLLQLLLQVNLEVEDKDKLERLVQQLLLQAHGSNKVKVSDPARC